MTTICNLPPFFPKKINKVWIFPAPQPLCDFENILKNRALQEILSQIPETEITQIRTLPDDVQIDSGQKTSDAGAFWEHSVKIMVVPNRVSNLQILNRFTNKKVLLALFTPSETFLVGCNAQPLQAIIEENTAHFVLKLSGQTSFPALRN